MTDTLAAEDLAARLRALENEVESLRARNAKLRDRAEYLERQTGALSVDRDRSVQAALAGQYRYLARRLTADRPQSDVQAHAVAGMLGTMALFAEREDGTREH